MNVIGSILDSFFQNNSAGFGGAIFYNSTERNGINWFNLIYFLIDSDLTLFNCKFHYNYAKYGGGAIYFLYLIPKNIFENVNNIFYYNLAREEINDWSSSPFRLILLNSSNNEFNINTSPQIINPLKLKSGVRFSLNLNIWPIDQFNQTVPIKTEYISFFIAFIIFYYIEESLLSSHQKKAFCNMI